MRVQAHNGEEIKTKSQTESSHKAKRSRNTKREKGQRKKGLSSHCLVCIDAAMTWDGMKWCNTLKTLQKHTEYKILCIPQGFES